MKTLVVRLAGLTLFVVAFFLPAVRGTGSGPGNGPMDGWMCAYFAGAATGGILRNGPAWEGINVPGMMYLILSGWVNPLVGMYLVLCLWPRLVRIRVAMAVAVLLCLSATWAFLAIAKMEPLIGHYLWAGGTLMILAGELTGLQSKKDAGELAAGGPVAP
jgi:hypothetical protein